MKKHVLVSITICSMIVLSLRSSEVTGQTATEDWTRETMPFLKGINFTNWLDDLWSGLPPNNRRWFDNFNESDFANAKSIGFDHIRLPIAPHTNAMNSPTGTIDAVYLQKLDLAVTWAEKYGLYLILDNHEFDGNHPTSEATEPLLLNAWKQLATRYKDRSELILYEVLNEPFNIDPDLWGAIQGRVVDLIRSIDDTHYIIVAGADWNSMWNMMNHLPMYPHQRLIYNFHFYEPGLLTHAGVGAQANVRDIPFPYDKARMPSPPAGMEDWIYSFYANYSTAGTEADLARQLNQAVDFADKNHVPIICTEYGCNRDNLFQEDRVRYIETVTRLFSERRIPHANWGYKYGGFGITLWDGNLFPGFPYNLNYDICRAMGLHPPYGVTDITVSPATVSVEKGKTQQFKATVSAAGGVSESITWTVTGATGSTISETGLLTISADETATTLIVTATSVFDGTKAGTATVMVMGKIGQINSAEEFEKLQFTVYPNPTDGAVTLEFETSGTYMITMSDMAGKTLLRQTFNDQAVVLDLGNYPPGVYLLTIDDGKGQTTTRIAKK